MHNTTRNHWWKKHSKELWAGLDKDECRGAFVFCATARRLEIDPGSGQYQPLTLFIKQRASQTWPDLPAEEREQILRGIFCDPLYLEPVGYSFFPETPKWQCAATLHVEDSEIPDGFDPVAAQRFCAKMRAYVEAGGHLAWINTRNAKAAKCAAIAISKIPLNPRMSDWQMETNAPTDLNQIKRWMARQATEEGQTEWQLDLSMKVRCVGKREKRNTLYPVNELNSSEVFAEFEQFDATRQPGKLIQAVRL